MSTTLSRFLQTKIKSEKLSLEALAKAIGVSTVSVRGVLKGASKPNKSTAEKYAAYTGVAAEEILGAKMGKKSAAKRGGTKTGAKAKAPKGRAARGGRKAAAGVSGKSLLVSVAQAAALLDDDIAVRVHAASKATRDLIDRILG